MCINTGGEKVFPEEVEEALKTHPSVRDAVVVGLPDPRFGETICGGRRAGGRRRSSTLAELKRARHDPPRRLQGAAHVVVVDSIARAANGKVDYKRLKALAMDRTAR